MDQFMPPAQNSALNAAKHWMAQEWPRYFGLKPLARESFLAPAVFLSGSNNNTSNPMHRREKHGRRPCCAADWHCCVLHGAVLCHAVPCCAVLCDAVPFRAVPCRAVPCCAVLSHAVPCRAVLHLCNSFVHCCKARDRHNCTPFSCLPFLHPADGTLAERVALGKRRREQLGIQTALDMQSSCGPSTSARQSDGTLPFSHGAPDRAAAGPLAGALRRSGSPGRAVAPAEGMMAKWGYTAGWMTLYTYFFHEFFRLISTAEWACVFLTGVITILSAKSGRAVLSCILRYLLLMFISAW